VPPSGIGQAVIFFEKTLKKVAISPNPLWQALEVIYIKRISIIIICFVLSSCATTIAHVVSNSKNCPYSYYAGTQINYSGLGDFITGEGNGNGLELVFIIDFPLSLISDTFVAPYYMVSSHGEGNAEHEDCQFDP